MLHFGEPENIQQLVSLCFGSALKLCSEREGLTHSEHSEEVIRLLKRRHVLWLRDATEARSRKPLSPLLLAAPREHIQQGRFASSRGPEHPEQSACVRFHHCVAERQDGWL